jgi:hypothetical protein
LPSQTTLSKEISFAQDSDRRFFPGFRNHTQLNFPLLYEVESVRGISLREDCLLLFEGQHIPSVSDGRKEGVGIESAFTVADLDLL